MDLENIGSFNSLIEELNISLNQVYYVVNNKDECYSSFTIRKFSGRRLILAPNNELKKIQRKILLKLFYRIPCHEQAMGFIRSKSILTNARKHVNQRVILKIDLKDFFPSIKKDRVLEMLKRIMPSYEWARTLTELCMYKGELPQGAPTSPYLSNLVCIKLDTRLNILSEKRGLVYTRYADDLIFSGKKINFKTKKLIYQIIKSEKFQINHKKSKLFKSGSRQRVTGLIVNKKLGVGRKEYCRLKAILHNCKNKGIESQNIHHKTDFKAHLYGRMALIKKTNYPIWKKLKILLESLPWDDYYTQEMEGSKKKFGHAIIDLMDSINKISEKSVFKSNNKLSADLFKEVKNRDDFFLRIQSLFQWIDTMNTTFYKQYLSPEETVGKKSIKIFETLNENYSLNLEGCINVWNEINILATLPRHPLAKANEEFYPICKRYSISILNPNYEKFYSQILVNFKNSLKILFNVTEKLKSS